MSITALASYFYMWYTRVPSPFGTREVRWLLVLRAVGGFFGVFGMYYSLLYMPLSEATVLTFLAPIVACYACSFLMPDEPFTRKQQLAGLVSLLGVVLIAQPFGGTASESHSTAEIVSVNGTAPSESLEGAVEKLDAYHHLIAILFGLLGVLGAACAYTVIRAIGTRTHALVSVTYFSTYTTIVSLVAMLAVPSVSFRVPGNVVEWTLLLGLGVAGFLMQYLLTAGLSYEPPAGSQGHGSRATSMVYTQMLFALFYDKVVMDSSPSPVSWAGSGFILGSALYVAIVRETRPDRRSDGQVHADEETDPRRKDVRDEERDLEEGQGLLAAPEQMELVERTEHSQ
jgi:drug/metabolite transporter (DMT)-like permease